ncbi:MAG: twin-arginine translocase subunit TatC [Flavobacteriales bacterium]|jgi:sec-independent protein translocase protein TatC|nr:twin-arginine translocase subunit TatC [Flavobacteriales bacterium]MCB0759258.1 twin-arginine translocase subunit TatC [Flavobacteriales bacterium]
MGEPRKELTFLEHLEALRWTLVRSAVAVLIGMVVAFIYKDFVFDTIILAPQRADFVTYRAFCRIALNMGLDRSFCTESTGFTLMNTSMGGQFMVHIMVSFVVGLIVAFPYILWEIWRFVKPGLAGAEQQAVRGVVFFASVLFMLGVVFGYYILAPMSIQFLGTYTISASVPNLVDLNSYIGTITSLTLWTGVVFELPMVVYFLARTGLLGPQFLRTYRRHAYVSILIIAAIITPPDISSQFIVSIPLIALYEGSILLAARTRRSMDRAEGTATDRSKP